MFEANSSPLIELDHVSKIYRQGQRDYWALRDITLSIPRGSWYAIMGPSGCGKSTFLNLLAGIDRPTSGIVRVAGTTLNGLSEEALTRWRRHTVGIVFQFFQLLPTLTVLENVELPLIFAGTRQARKRAQLLLERVGVAHLADRLPPTLSGGEQQRVAIARALANDPPLILADEPTGNLDSAASEQVMQLFQTLWQEGRTIVLVTHDSAVAQWAQATVHLRDGQIIDLVENSAGQGTPEHVPHYG
ncbi:MAG: ABC transporter ATP-binding protein [Thermorudis peleae]|nr:ABC transporter ATP-binding protein [Thermorudis peleae]